MEKKMRPDIDAILKNRGSIEETQEQLSHLSIDDMESIVKEAALKETFEAYKTENRFKPDRIPSFTESEKTVLWQRIRVSSQKKTAFHLYVFRKLRKLSETLLSFFSPPSNTWRMAFAVLILVAASPSLLQMIEKGAKEYRGAKGDGLVQASIHYAIVGHDNKLLRPERPLTEKDTLAFRIKTKEKGYFSLCVFYNHRVDLVTVNRYLTETENDLKEGYELEGNRGLNRLVLLYSSLPITTPAEELKNLVIELYKNNASSVTIDNNKIFLSYEKLEVE